jgi:uncharacterized protein (DUF736 family)
MANYEQRDNSGVLFANNKKKNDREPDYRGDSMVNGQVVEVSAWSKPTKNGGLFLSLSFREKQEYRPSQREIAPEREPGEDDDVPF